MNVNKSECLGRSMWEMLGVLAIVGLLTVGIMALYSKAMERYRTNSIINQVAQIVTNTRNMFGHLENRDYLSLDLNVKSMSDKNYANRKIADKLKLFPESIRDNNYLNAYNGKIQYFADGRYKDNDGKAFVLEFYDIPQEACIEIVTKDWNAQLGLVAMKVKGSADGYSIQAGALTGKCKTQYKTGVGLFCAENFPVTLQQAALTCNNTKSNNLSWKFY